MKALKIQPAGILDSGRLYFFIWIHMYSQLKYG